MKTIILIGDENFSMEDIFAINHQGSIHTQFPGIHDGYTVYFETGDSGRQFLSYGIYLDAEIEFSDEEKEELAKIPYKEFNMIAIDFYEEKLLKRIFMQEGYLRDKGIYVSPIYGGIISLEEFVAKGCIQKLC